MMTNKQVYNELAKIAGYHCSDDLPFICTKKVLRGDLKRIQSHLRALLEKLQYERTWHDFGSRGDILPQIRMRRHTRPASLTPVMDALIGQNLAPREESTLAQEEQPE